MTTQRLAQAFLDLTRALVTATKNSDAAAFKTLLSEREKVLSQISEIDDLNDDAEQIKALLVEAQQLNTQLLSDFTHDRDVLVQEKQAIKKGAAMRAAYQQHK